MKKFGFVFIGAVALVSCQKGISIDDNKENQYFYSFTASQESESKTVINNFVSMWSGDEAIRVLGKDNKNYIFQTSVNEPVETAVFTYSGSEKVQGFGDDGNSFYAVYPSGSADLTANNTNHTISGITVPTTQTAVEGSYDVMAPVAVAYCTDGKTLEFKNVTALVKFQVLVEGVTKVTFSGNNREPLSGGVSVSYNNGEPAFTTDNTKTYVELICDDGFKVGMDYYFSILPNTFSSGFKIEINGIRARNLTKEKTIKRSSCLTDVTLGSVIPSVIYENGDWTISKGVMTDLGNRNYVKKGVTISASGFRIADGAALKSTIKTGISPKTWYNIHFSQSDNMILEGTYDIYVHKEDYGMFCCVVNKGDKMPVFKPENMQLYIVLEHKWWNQNALWAWDSETNYTGGTWPGQVNNGTISLFDHKKTYYYWEIKDSANGKALSLIFNDNGNGGQSAENKEIKDFSRDYCFWLDDKANATSMDF